VDNEQKEKITWSDNIKSQIKSGNANATCRVEYNKSSNTTTLDFVDILVFKKYLIKPDIKCQK
ncbi:hypothetical protein, partial [Clostridioides difficile]|uniref:hypothetical protein n=1 Tax=Clostridioides difficile TaxID=1496 RepID=UPI00115E95AF